MEKESEVVLKFPEVEKLAGSILTLSEISFAYPEIQNPVFQHVDLSATMESRICIVSTKDNIRQYLTEVQGVYTRSVYFKIDTVSSLMTFETNKCV